MAEHEKTPDPKECYDFVDEMNGLIAGYNRAMELHFQCATTEEVVAELPIGPQHLQPYGLVHGGVYCGMVETACSTGAALNALQNGQSTVGLDNNTSFLRAVRRGTLTVRAVPLARGRRTHVWEAKITDDDDRVVAAGRVRLLCIDAGEETAGETLKIRRGDGK